MYWNHRIGRLGGLILAGLFVPILAQGALDDIVPRPKQVRSLGRSLPIHGWGLWIGPGPKCRIGAEEINARVRRLGGKPLPVHGLGTNGSGAVGAGIVLAPCSANGAAEFAAAAGVTRADPGPQGYAVRVQELGRGGAVRVLLIGSDPQGALYAAETMRRLVVPGRSSSEGPAVQLADIRDWPDYLYRCCGVPFEEPLRGDWYRILSCQRRGDLAGAERLARQWVVRPKQYIDWMLRAKMNMAWFPTNIRPGDSPDGLPVTRRMLREVNQYALARGIRSIAADTTAIGTWPRDKDKPGFQDIVFNRAHKRYFCWSRLDLHRARARRAAKWLADCGYTGYYLHACDSGGWRDPALWSRRCPRCRRNYGDDHAKADATVFNLYYRTIEKAVPGLAFNVVVYPYTGRYLDPDYVAAAAKAETGDAAAAQALGRRVTRTLRAFLERLNALLAPDIRVCLRESERDDFRRARAAWGRRNFFTYFEYAYWKGWRPYFVTTPLFTTSLFDPAHRADILYGNVSGTGWTELTQLLGAECAWNTRRPGAREFDSRVWHDLGTRVSPPPERRRFALRACRFWFGDRAGPLLAPVFAENISWTFIAFPERVQRYLHLHDAVKVMRNQAEACARAAKSLDRLWVLQEQQTVLDGPELGYFLNLYRITRGAAVVAAYRAEMMAARQAVEQQDAAAARRHYAAARQGIVRAKPGWQAFLRKLPEKQFLAPYLRRTAAPGYLMNPDLDGLIREAASGAAHVDRRIAAYAIPRWFRQDCRRRRLAAVRAATPPVIDGKLDDNAWRRSPPIQHFLDNRILRLESLETTARLAWDASTLYVAFDCRDPDPAGIRTKLPGRDIYALCDSIEVLVSPGPGSREFRHWIVDSFGTVFDAAQRRSRGGAYRYSSGWNGHARVKTRKSPGRWCVEMAIPAGDLGFSPGMDCRAHILLCRNIVHTHPRGERESVAVVFLDGAGFHAVERFPPVRFVQAPVPGAAAPHVALVLRPLEFSPETTGAGTGVRFGGGLQIFTDENLHDVRISATYSDGIARLGRVELGRAPLVELVWRPKTGFSQLAGRNVPGIACRFQVTAAEGRWRFVRRFGRPWFRRPPPDRLFAPGVSGKSVALPVCFLPPAGVRIRRAEGTIEFWVRPHWNGARSRPPEPQGELEHTLVNIGPIRPDYPELSNYECLTIYHNCYGRLRAVMANSEYESRSVEADVSGWRAGQWHHVALTWKLNDGGKTAMALFVDGRPISGKCRGVSRRPNTRPLRLDGRRLPVQIGSMNTGFRPAEADLDEFRVSRIRRYRAPFRPSRRAAGDADTVVLFHFDGSLAAARPASIAARPGPAQSQEAK